MKVRAPPGCTNLFGSPGRAKLKDIMSQANDAESLLSNWDPLGHEIPPEVASATVKRQIRNILKSYTGWFDPLAELLQNALDAVDLRQRREAESDYHPTIWVQID